jgi:DMSO/TMAO reductase YedYZ heme-binding membrane subunit
MSSQLWWYTARAGGLVAWVLATASVVWGLLLSGRMTDKRPRPAWVLDLHRFLGGLTVVFVGVHVLAIWLDSFVHFGPAELFVPLASTWKPVAVAWGVVALYLLLAIEITSLLQRHIPRRVWHAVHLSSFGLFAFATIHALTAGTDSGSTPVIWFAIFSTVLIASLTVLRVVSGRADPAPARDRVGAVRQSAVARPSPGA